jgi:hypothetical protein
MCIITGIKILTVFIVSSFDPTMSLLLSFCFGVLECIFGIPVFLNVFYALLHLISVENLKAQEREASVKRFTIFAFIARHALAFLPDLSALTLNNAFTLDADYSFMRFKPLLVGFAFIISLGIGIAWLVKFIAYLKCAVTKDFEAWINSEYGKKVKSKKSVFEAKDNLRVITIISIASVFLFDFNWGYTNADIFQDFMLPVVAILTLLYLLIKKSYKLDKMFLLLTVTFAVQLFVNIFEIQSNIKFFDKYNLASILRVSEAESWYFNVVISSILSALMLVASCLAVWIATKHNAKKSILEHKGLFSERDIDYYLQEYGIRTKKKTIILSIFSIMSAIISVLTVIFVIYADWLILVNYVAQILLIIVFVSSMLYIYDEVYKRILIFS